MLYLDESGSLVLETCHIITVAALIVAQKDIDLLRPVLPRIRKKLNQRRKAGKKITQEFKFQTLYGHREFGVIRQVMAAISMLPCHLIIVRVEKGCRIIEDNSLNYAILLSETIRLSKRHYPKAEYIFDRHYPPSQFDKMQHVNHALARILGEPLDILHKDSQDRRYPGLGLVDFVAGVARFVAEAEESAPGYRTLCEGLDLVKGLLLEKGNITWDELAAECHEALRIPTKKTANPTGNNFRRPFLPKLRD